MRIFILLLFISTQAFSDQLLQAVWPINKFENKDGTWGEGNKEILTSLSLLSHLAHGETTTSKRFGEKVKKMMKALVKMEKELVKTKTLTIKHAYVLWALSEAYAMTGQGILEDSCESLCEFALKFCNEANWITADKQSYTFFSNVLSSAFYSCKQSDLKAVEEINLKEIIKNALSVSRLNCRMLNEDKMILMQISTRWDINLDTLQMLLPLKKKYVKSDYEKVNKIITKLNGDSKSRKLVQKEIKALPTKLYRLLIKQLQSSTIVELQEASKDYSAAYTIEEPGSQNQLFEEFKTSPSTFFSATAYYFIKNQEDWKSWSKQLQAHWGDLQDKEGLWSDPSLESPEFLKLSDYDSVLFHTCYAALNLTIYYRYLPGFKSQVKRKIIQEDDLDLFEEEGLDLVE